MHNHVFYNGKIVRTSRAKALAVTDAILYGFGVFTTIAIDPERPLLWEKHWRRLRDHSSKIGLDISEYPDETVRSSVDQIVEANALSYGRVRVTFFNEALNGVWSYKSGGRTSLLIMSADFPVVPSLPRLGLSRYRINTASPLTGVKSCNYADKVITLAEAKRRNFFEAVQLNERGEVASACMANLMWKKGDKLFTPSLKTGCLAGTTREFMMENLEFEESIASLDTLRRADAIFLSSAGLEVIIVSEFEGKKLDSSGDEILKSAKRRR